MRRLEGLAGGELFEKCRAHVQLTEGGLVLQNTLAGYSRLNDDAVQAGRRTEDAWK